MVELQAITSNGQGTALSEEAIEDFRKSLGGPLILPGDGEYDEARSPAGNPLFGKFKPELRICSGHIFKGFSTFRPDF